MAKLTALAAGLLLSSVLAVSAAVPMQAAADCKSSWGNAACPSSKASKPTPASKPQATSKSGQTPKPLVEPKAVRNAIKAATPGKVAGKPSSPLRHSPHRVARHVVDHKARASVEPLRQHRLQNPPQKEAQQIRPRPFDDYRPRSGPVYQSGPAYWAAAPSDGYRCDEACQYRDWLNRYSAWYRSYGWYYGAGRSGAGASPPVNPGPATAYGNNAPRYNYDNGGYYGSGLAPDQSERDRLDPWHGYNAHDGLGNGY